MARHATFTRRLLAYAGVDSTDVAAAEGCTAATVRANRRNLGVDADDGTTARRPAEISFDELDRMMRSNRGAL